MAYNKLTLRIYSHIIHVDYRVAYKLLQPNGQHFN